MTPLIWKVYDPKRNYIASAKYAEDAAMLVSSHGSGSVVKCNGSIVWREGAEEISAGESYDVAASTMETRKETAIDEHFRRRGMRGRHG